VGLVSDQSAISSESLLSWLLQRVTRAFISTGGNNVGACTGTSRLYIFQDLTTFNLGTFDGPTDPTFSPSAINQFNRPSVI
jgi:hypothetical protein